PDLRRHRRRAAGPGRGQDRLMRTQHWLARGLGSPQEGRDKGGRRAGTPWRLIFAIITVSLLFLVVDGGQVIVAKSRAADIAEQAARAAADDINPGALRNGDVAIAAGAC